jgi:hypothetical protein
MRQNIHGIKTPDETNCFSNLNPELIKAWRRARPDASETKKADDARHHQKTTRSVSRPIVWNR